MILARFFGMVIFIVPAVVIATACKSITSSMLDGIADFAGLTVFETAMILLIPYLVLVYCAIINPIVNFWQTLRGKSSQQTQQEGGYPNE